MTYSTTILVKEYGNNDDNAAHVYEHMFLNRHRALLEETYPSLTHELYGITFIKPVITINATFTDSATQSLFQQNLTTEEVYTEEDLALAISELECEDTRRFTFDHKELWDVIHEITSLSWIPYEKYGYKDFYLVPYTPRKIMRYRTKRESYKKITINFDLPYKYFGNNSEYASLMLRLVTPLHNWLTSQMVQPSYFMPNRVAEYDTDHLHSDIVIHVPRAVKIQDIKNVVTASLQTFTSPELFRYIQQELRAFAASPTAAYSWGVQYYLKESGFLIGGKGIEELLTQQNIDYIINHLEVSFMESPVSAG